MSDDENYKAGAADGVARRIEAVAAADGLSLLGGFQTRDGDGAPEGVAALYLLGYDGPRLWTAFSASPEYADGAPHPLDRWTRRVGEDIAAAVGATAFFPFGEPRWPFLRWAGRAEPVSSSPIGMFVSPTRGLWTSYRLALGTAESVDPAALVAPAPRPCDSCAERPCLSACPVDAFAEGGYDVAACARHVRSAAGEDCRARGCLARRACPVGPDRAQQPAQAAFHMAAFLAARDDV